MSSAKTEAIINAIQATEKDYQPSPEVARSLHTKTLIMLVGPVAVGKSFIIDQVTANDPEFKQVSVFTTRDARPGETSDVMRTHPHTDEFLNSVLSEIKHGNLVQYTVHPTTGRLYGTTPDDFNAQYNMLPSLSGAVELHSRLPFAALFTICLAARPEVWKLWLDSRYPDKDAERTRRINEAIISLEWALDDKRASTVLWVENDVQTPERTIENIINIVKYNHQSDPEARKYAEQMLEMAKNEREGAA